MKITWWEQDIVIWKVKIIWIKTTWLEENFIKRKLKILLIKIIWSQEIKVIRMIKQYPEKFNLIREDNGIRETKKIYRRMKLD